MAAYLTMGSTNTTAFNKDKMKHVILYFLEHINNIHLGRTKLMKLLYYVDFDNFEKYGAAVSGARYRKLPLGPVPDEAEDVIEEMERTGEVEQVKSVSFVNGKPTKYVQNRLISKSAKFNPSLFTGAELEVIERVAKVWEDATATEMKDASHKEAPWAATEDGKVIDYEMAQYRSPLGEEDDVEEILKNTPSFTKFVSSLK
jgi:uncharacterized phage-associated protein